MSWLGSNGSPRSTPSVVISYWRVFGSWALPHGCVDVGESALDAAIRETEEEVGVRIRSADLFGI